MDHDGTRFEVNSDHGNELANLQLRKKLHLKCNRRNPVRSNFMLLSAELRWFWQGAC